MKKVLTSYDILNVRTDATQADIHAAYRRLAMAWHPDRHAPARKADADRHFKLLQEAYDKIKTPENRKAYNRWLDTRTHAVLQRQNAALNDNKPLRSFFDALETIFWPIERADRGREHRE